MEYFPNLFTPGRLGHLQLPNRIVMPPMGTRFGSPDGCVTDKTLDYYEARAAGGAGLVIVEYSCIDFPIGRGTVSQLAISDDRHLSGLTELTATIKRHGAAALIQLHHAGREADTAGLGMQPVAPSAVRSLNPKAPEPRALTVGQIGDLVDLFVAGAQRAKKAGFDGVELHAAHSYLISQFLSPLSNRRTDEYGGTLWNRARLVLDLTKAIRRHLGPVFALSVRLTADEFAPGGITIDETCQVASWLADVGADAIHVSAGGLASPRPVTVAPLCFPRGHFLTLAERVKQVLRVPVIGVGRINTPEAAECALRDGKCDFVSVGRGLIADPEFPHKAIEGRVDEIRPCLACLQCLPIHSYDGKPVPLSCATNPQVGREREFARPAAPARKRVFVFGGGVAGMEAALVAAKRGHHVTLFERADHLGGQLIAAAIPPHKSELNLLRAYYESQLRRAKVDIRLGTQADSSTLSCDMPDVVIVAAGSQPKRPEIPGVNGRNVTMAEAVLLGRVAAGQRVAIIGGELVACETAEHLAAQGKRVTLLRRGPRLATKVQPFVRRALLDRLAVLGVATITGVKLLEIDERGVVFSQGDDCPRLLEADTVVIATGATPNRALLDEISGKLGAFAVVGDAVEPRSILDAIREGNAAGMAI